MGYFFVPFPLGVLESVPGDVFEHAESIDTFFRNIFSGSKNRHFSSVGVRAILPKRTKFLKVLKLAFFTRLSPDGPQFVANITWESF